MRSRRCGTLRVGRGSKKRMCSIRLSGGGRAACATSDSEVERNYPWGDEAPDGRYGNFDFMHWDPSPVGSYPRGASAHGVHDLLGNGWEWTRTEFKPFPGFSPMPFYPGYSANFFDGKHYVMKGGSPRTAA